MPRTDTRLTFETLGDPLELRTFRIETALSRPTRVELECVAPDPELDLESLLGVRAALSLGVARVGEPALTLRLVCDRAEQVRAEPNGLSTYRVGLVHALGLLALRKSYRVHQRASVVDVVAAVLRGHDLSCRFDLDEATYPALEYCVQYDETDLDFVSRLLARAGIVYACEPGPDGTTVVLADDPGKTGLHAAPLWFSDGESDRREARWAGRTSRGARTRPAAVVLAPRDDLHPRLELRTRVAVGVPGGEHYVHRATAGLTSVSSGSTPTPVADAKGAARFDPSWIETLATRHLDALRSGAREIAFESNALDVVAGRVVTIHGHPHHEVDGHPLLVRRAVSKGEVDGEWNHVVEAGLADAPYRVTAGVPDPRAFSVDVATVTGPAGEPIHVDEFGRVRVRFHWDRYGTSDDDSSCWLHVSQAWAGPSYGLHAVPRVGNEVLVAFVGGDPDHPVVVGRVHGGAAPPPFDMPDEKTKTGIRTQVPGGSGYNELSFDDLPAEERVHLRAEKDLDVLVRHDRTARVQNDDATVVERDQRLRVDGQQRTTIVGDRHVVLESSDDERLRGSRTSAIDGDVRVDVGGSHSTHVGANERRETLGLEEHTIHGDAIRKVLGNAATLVGSHDAPRSASLVVEGTASLTTADAIDVISEREIVLRVGASFLHVTASEIVLSSPKLTLLGKDARIELDEGAVRTKVKTAFQVVSDDAVVLKSAKASVALQSQVKVDGVRILLNSPAQATDEIRIEEPEPTELELVDQDGKPLANRLYRIELDDGRQLLGFLDHEGKATVHTKGGGTISFPDVRNVEPL